MKKKDKILPEEEEKELLAAEETPAGTAPEETEPSEPETAAPQPARSEDAMREDVALFHELFPEVTAKMIPKEVWEKVEKGESLAASFALHRMMQEREDERIRKINEENAASAPPRIRHDGADGAYFSPEMVKQMSQAEVRKNYNQILKSMDQWN